MQTQWIFLIFSHSDPSGVRHDVSNRRQHHISNFVNCERRSIAACEGRCLTRGKPMMRNPTKDVKFPSHSGSSLTILKCNISRTLS